jgi:hypothetical protein
MRGFEFIPGALVHPLIYCSVVVILAAICVILSLVTVPEDPVPATLRRGALLAGAALDCTIVLLYCAGQFPHSASTTSLRRLFRVATRVAWIAGSAWVTVMTIVAIVCQEGSVLDALIFGEPNLGIVGAAFFRFVSPGRRESACNGT